MGCASNKNQDGFTLVEISIVMIIIGLLIGGTFGGMKLIENMQINSSVQFVKSVESAVTTFRDAYGRPPGDITNASARLPNCGSVPCSQSGNGDRRLDVNLAWNDAIASTNERFTFWHHLSAADLISGVSPTTNMEFGEGQPQTPLGTGFRMTFHNASTFISTYDYGKPSHIGFFTNTASTALSGFVAEEVVSGRIAESLDRKMDDGFPIYGRVGMFGGCYIGPQSPTAPYTDTSLLCSPYYVFHF